jgi:hypothetical protein
MLPKVHIYKTYQDIGDTIFQPNDCYKKVTVDYLARTTPFIIRDNLILETITDKQPIIKTVTEHMPRKPAISNAL